MEIWARKVFMKTPTATSAAMAMAVLIMTAHPVSAPIVPLRFFQIISFSQTIHIGLCLTP